MNELETYSPTSRDIIKMVVGNKIDREESRQVTKAEGEQFAKKTGSLFIEASAKTREGVRDAFAEVVRKVTHSLELLIITNIE